MQMRNAKWLIGAGCVVSVSAAIWWAARQISTSTTASEHAAPPVAAIRADSTLKKISPTASSHPDPSGQQEHTPMNGQSEGAAWGNMLETSADLRDVFDRLKGSKNPVARNVAYRAWTACFPTFVSPDGQPIMLERILRTVSEPGANHAARHDAYRRLYQRCAGFFKMNRETTVLTTQLQQDGWDRGESLAPGELATKLLRDGDDDRALAIARSVVASKDAYAVASLQGFINLSLTLKRDLEPDPGIERADIRSLAYAIAACQLGLDCGPTSLTALRLCANGSQCEGSAIDRMVQLMPNANDRDAVIIEARRIAAAIESGDISALGLSKN
jgi:hypothetical protein